MLKILLVDDEVAICRGMKALIMRDEPEGVIVAEAYDGVEALDMMGDFDPDVLLTDIRMPRMDGLQLLREAKKRKPELLTAVISAYSDYGYVREAILTHASDDYLLKPATAQEIQELLRKLKLKRQQLKISQEQEALGLLLQGMNLDHCPPTLQYSQYALILVCAGPYCNGVMDLHPGEAWWPSSLLAEYLKRCEELGLRHWLLNGERPNERLLLLASHAYDDEDRIRASLDPVLLSLLNQPMPVAWIMESDLSLHQLHATSKQLRRELVHSHVFAKSHVRILRDPGIKETDTDRKFIVETAKVIEAVGRKREKPFTEALHALIASWESSDATQYSMLQTLFRILTEFGDLGLERQFDLEVAVSHSLTYVELEQHVTALFHNLFESMPHSADQAAPFHTIVSQVEQYLKMNFRKTVTLQSLSEEFRLVPNYLSVLFKREIGITPIEYLMDYRIKEAKRIMDERPHLLLKQVASEVGYADQLYFSRVFKKLTGQSPSEYVHSRQ